MDSISKKPMYLVYADGMRVVAIFAVISIHSAATGVIQYGKLDETQWWCANFVDSMCRWAVPVFIMLSGALILDPLRQVTLLVFYKKRLKRVGIPLLAWSTFYFFWSATYHGLEVTTKYVIDALLNGLTHNHLYFLFIILGLYMITPVLRAYLRHVSLSWQWFFALTMLIMASTGSTYNFIKLNAFTQFVPYVGYFVLGFLLRDIRLIKMFIVFCADNIYCFFRDNNNYNRFPIRLLGGR